MTTSCITAERLVTTDGTVWTLREIGGDGDGRYAPERVKECPRWVLEPGSRLTVAHGAKPEAPKTQVPDLSMRLGETWMSGVLRVDAIQRRALLEMAATWSEHGGEDDIVSAMAVLADTIAGDPTVEEEDAAVEAAAAAAMLQNAEVEITLDEARRLRGELDAVIARLERGSNSVAPKAVAA